MASDKNHCVNEVLLLSQLAAGSEDAFDRIYDLYWSYVVNEAYKRLGNKDQAKDIAQEVFTSLWLRATDRPIDNLRAWLFVATRNNVYKVLQQTARFLPVEDLVQELQSAGNDADMPVIIKDLKRACECAIRALPSQQRLIYRMRFNDELTPDEIASQLKLSSKTVRNHLGRALLKLKATFLTISALLLTL